MAKTDEKRKIRPSVVEFELPKQERPVIKELATTKRIYTEMVRDAWSMLLDAKKSQDKLKIQTAYGIYHNTFTGLIRSGIMCERYVGVDGFPEILVRFEQEKYIIRESILKSLLGMDCEQIVHPWKDASTSYLDDMEKFPEKYMMSNGFKLKDEADEHDLSLELDDARKEMESMDKEHQSELNSLNSKYSREINKLKKALENRKAEFDNYRQNIEAEAREKEKYVYDPNYDHYYHDTLPALVNEIEFASTDILVRAICIGVSVVFVLLSCIFLI